MRQFKKDEFKIFDDNSLGNGAFGQCYLGSVGPLDVCMKVFKHDRDCYVYFPREVHILLQCCHDNLPFFMAYMMLL